MRLTIRKKLLGGFLLVVLLLVGTVLVGNNGLRSSQSSRDYLVDRYKRINLWYQLEAAFFKEARAIVGYTYTQDNAYMEDYKAANGEKAELLRQAEKLVMETNDQQTRLMFNDIMAHNKEYERLTPQAFALKRIPQSIIDARVRTFDGITAFISYREQQVELERKKADEQAARLTWLLWIITLVAVAASSAIGLLLSASISNSVRQAAAMAQNLAEGDLTVEEIRVSTNDETKAMASNLNYMLNNLRNLIRGISGLAHSVSVASHDLNIASEQSAQAAENAAQAVQQLASGASQQARSADHVTTTMEQLQQTIQQIASGSQQTAADVQDALGLLNQMVDVIEQVNSNVITVTENTTQATNLAHEGATVVEQAVEAMGNIEQAAGDTARRINELEELSQQIGQITEVISGVADQTNLLALNAAIEAARAGEHGRGFAVVAEEVRKLAEKSDESAREIAELINNVKARTSNAVNSMEAGASAVQTGSKMAKDAGEALLRISQAVESAAREVHDISIATRQIRDHAQQVLKAFDSVAAVTEEATAGTEEMAAAAAQVTTSMENIAPVAQENAAMAEELSSTIEELSASSEEVASSATSLATTAQNLLQQVSQFKVADNQSSN